MKKIIKKLGILFILILLILANKTYAAGSFSVSSSKTTINKGESVTVSIKGNNAYGKVNITATNAKVNVASVFLQNDTQNVTVTSTSSEDIKVTVSPASSGLGDIDENPITGSQSITVKVNGGSNTGTNNSNSNPNTGNNTGNNNNPTTSSKSSNANVKMITTSPVDFSGFKASKNSGYEVTVDNNVDKINVNVTKEDSKATVSLLNKTNSDKGKSWVYIAEGKNEIDIIVTAEAGNTQKYTISVTRKQKDEQTPEKTEEQQSEKPVEETPEETSEDPMKETFGLSELKIEGIELEPQFQTDIYEYKVNLKEDIQKLNITALATENNSNIEIVGNEELKEGENIITIIVKGENEEKTATYQVIVNKALDIKEGARNSINKQNIIIISIAVGTVFIVIIALIIIKIRKAKSSDNSGYIPYENVIDNYEQGEKEENNYAENEDYDAEPKKKRHSKGKRFK